MYLPPQQCVSPYGSTDCRQLCAAAISAAFCMTSKAQRSFSTGRKTQRRSAHNGVRSENRGPRPSPSHFPSTRLHPRYRMGRADQSSMEKTPPLIGSGRRGNRHDRLNASTQEIKRPDDRRCLRPVSGIPACRCQHPAVLFQGNAEHVGKPEISADREGRPAARSGKPIHPPGYPPPV